jgi:hypothetical protein
MMFSGVLASAKEIYPTILYEEVDITNQFSIEEHIKLKL